MSLLQIFLFLALNLNVNMAYFETSENISTYQEGQPLLVTEKKGKRREGDDENADFTNIS
jgi:hypothetical protein